MSELLQLRGRSALSPFRLEKLMCALNLEASDIAHVHAEYWHFAEVSQALRNSENATLQQILTYGPAVAVQAPQGALVLVVPRLGTISPWSSKATDIARHCGLEKVQRIERGIAFYIQKKSSSTVSIMRS